MVSSILLNFRIVTFLKEFTQYLENNLFLIFIYI